jgi:hypothetical protein
VGKEVKYGNQNSYQKKVSAGTGKRTLSVYQGDQTLGPSAIGLHFGGILEIDIRAQ